MTSAVVVGALGVAIAFVLAALLTVRYAEEPGASPYLILVLLLATMSVMVAAGATERVSGTFVLQTLLAGWILVAVAWAAFAFAYTGRGPTMTRKRILALFALGCIGTLSTFTAELYGALTQVAVLLVAPLFIIVLSLALFGCFLTARAGLGSGDIPANQSVTLTAGGSGVTLVFLGGNLETVLPVETVLTALTLVLGVTAGLLLLARLQFGLFETGPGTGYLARETVLDRMSACMLLVDREGQILDCNRATERTFGISQPAVLGQPVSSVLSRELTAGLSSLETSAGRREFDISSSELRNRQGRQVGQVHLLRDVTERRTHEQRLDVLNRVLRHNLRNELDAIRAFAEALPESDEPTELAERITETSQGLVETAATVARVERLLARETPSVEAINLAALARELAGARPAVHVEAHPVTLRTNRQLLVAALSELLDNAVEHSNSEQPTVELRMQATESGARLEVRDDGPGIPERERAVLLAGEETPLRHGSGLGLWLVYWSVTRLGGELSFRENSPSGSVVILDVPQQEQPA